MSPATPEPTVSWGIIGPGGIAKRFATELPRSRTGRLLAVGSRDLARAQAFAAAHGAARAYGSYAELLADPDVDAVYVATPHPLHGRWTVLAAEAGKHVLCEKPLTLNRPQTHAVLEAVRRCGVVLMEAYMYRSHPQVARIVQLIRDGAIGRLLQVEASFAFAATPNEDSRLYRNALGGGGILDVGGYPASFACLLAGAANGEGFAAPLQVTAGGSLHRTGIDTWAVATLSFSGGISAHLTTGIGLSDANRVRAVGSAGFIEVPYPWLPDYQGAAELLVHRVGAEPERIGFEPFAMYAAEADAMAAAIAAPVTDPQAPREAALVPWSDTRTTMGVLDAWRAGLGQIYDEEKPDAVTPTLTGRPLSRRADAPMRYGTIRGVDQPVSRLVMGVDNQTSLAKASAMFDDFVERGGNCFDTAYIYGRGETERLLGRWVRNRGIRDDVVVIGKGAHTPHCDPESIDRQLVESLERQQTDHFDIYLLHRDNPRIPVGDFVETLDAHRRAGRIRAYGGSNWSLERFAAANAYAAEHGLAGFTVLSNNFSLARALDVPWAGCVSSSDDASRAVLERDQITLLPWSSQARGFFTGRARPDDRSDDELARCWYSAGNFERLARARELAERYDVDPVAIALAYVLNQTFPTFPLIGPRAIEETRSSVRALDVPLTPAEVGWLDLRTEQA